jgi:hypothetical protein
VYLLIAIGVVAASAFLSHDHRAMEGLDPPSATARPLDQPLQSSMRAESLAVFRLHILIDARVGTDATASAA